MTPVQMLVIFATLMVAVNASRRHARNMHSAFTCGPQGIKHLTNETIGPNVSIMCPKMEVKMDTSTEIICDVISSTFAIITWFYNGQPISNKNHVKVDRRSCNQTLKIKFAKTKDGGNYTCQVANNVGNVRKTCPLVVKADKSKQRVLIEYLKIAGHHKKAFLRGSVNLTCNMLNADVSMWLRNGNRIISKRHVWKRKDTFGGRGMMFHLEIVNVTKSDEGLYMCRGQKNGIPANKTLYLQTEPCPRGYYCPHNGNKAIPCPTAWTDSSESHEELEGCFSKSPYQEPEKPMIASVTSKSVSTHNPECMLLFMSVYIYGYLHGLTC